MIEIEAPKKFNQRVAVEALPDGVRLSYQPKMMRNHPDDPEGKSLPPEEVAAKVIFWIDEGVEFDPKKFLRDHKPSKSSEQEAKDLARAVEKKFERSVERVLKKHGLI